MPSFLLQEVFIGTLNRLNIPSNPFPMNFGHFVRQMLLIFFSLKKTFMKVSPINFIFSPVTPFAIFSSYSGLDIFFFQVSTLELNQNQCLIFYIFTV